MNNDCKNILHHKGGGVAKLKQTPNNSIDFHHFFSVSSALPSFISEKVGYLYGKIGAATRKSSLIVWLFP